MTTDPGDLVLDPTCGSGTTAYVAEQWGRRWITVDTSRVALALARTRLMAGHFPYYHLADDFPDIRPADTDDTIRAIVKQNGSLKGRPTDTGDIRKGFIYRRVPHITLKSIANNPDIREGMSRDEIDAAIARHADTEQLFDKPYEDARRIRVAGPFTVESLSPHRMLTPDFVLSRGAATEPSPGREPRVAGASPAKPPKGATHAARNGEHGNFEHMIIEHLRSAGVQNTRKSERLKFDSLEPRAGVWIHAAGEYTDSDGKTRRVAISIGPEHGTVGPDQVKEAAKEAVQGIGYDLLLVCGFAFDPHVSEESKRYGKLTVLPTRMNPDLAMWGGQDNELLKKTGAANLFMVFGEPDVEIKREPRAQARGNGDRSATRDQITVTIRGVDVYDPTTGQIRSSSTDDIACWFIDTEYDGESFMVRHAYFTGADEPYEKLKRALRAEIDQAAWASLYSTVSRHFDVPASGRIAIKVINHYGDEVMKVFNL
jgi:adenine-specific DNA-methyltransferase